MRKRACTGFADFICDFYLESVSQFLSFEVIDHWCLYNQSHLGEVILFEEYFTSQYLQLSALVFDMPTVFQVWSGCESSFESQLFISGNLGSKSHFIRSGSDLCSGISTLGGRSPVPPWPCISPLNLPQSHWSWCSSIYCLRAFVLTILPWGKILSHIPQCYFHLTSFMYSLK